MANGGQTKQDLLDQIDELQQENQDLQDQLDAISDIVSGADQGATTILTTTARTDARPMAQGSRTGSRSPLARQCSPAAGRKNLLSLAALPVLEVLRRFHNYGPSEPVTNQVLGSYQIQSLRKLIIRRHSSSSGCHHAVCYIPGTAHLPTAASTCKMDSAKCVHCYSERLSCH